MQILNIYAKKLNNLKLDIMRPCSNLLVTCMRLILTGYHT